MIQVKTVTFRKSHGKHTGRAKVIAPQHIWPELIDFNGLKRQELSIDKQPSSLAAA